MIQDRLRIPEGLPQRMAMIHYVTFPKEKFVLLTHTEYEFCVGCISLGFGSGIIVVSLKNQLNIHNEFYNDSEFYGQSYNSLQSAGDAAAHRIVMWHERYRRVYQPTLFLLNSYECLINEDNETKNEDLEMYKIDRFKNKGPLTLALNAIDVRVIGQVRKQGYMFEIKKILDAFGLSRNQSFLSEN